MILNDIYKKNNNVDVYVTYAKSSEYLDMVLRMVSSRYHVLKNEVIYLDNINDIVKHKTLLDTVSLFSDKYLFFIEDNTSLPKKEVIDLLATSNTYKIVMGVTNYGVVAKMRSYEMFNQRVKVDYLYSSRLAKDEFDLLYSYVTGVRGSSKLSLELQQRVKLGYLQEVSAVFSLFDYLKDGFDIKTVDELVSLIGLGNLSVDSIVYSLLTTTAGTERGIKMFKKKVTPKLMELMKRLSPSTIQAQMLEGIKAAYDIKVLCLRGYLLPGVDSKAKDIQGYDNPRLSYFERRRDSLQLIPLSRIINIMTLMDNEVRWDNEYQVLGFLDKCMMIRNLAKIKGSVVGD